MQQVQRQKQVQPVHHNPNVIQPDATYDNGLLMLSFGLSERDIEYERRFGGLKSFWRDRKYRYKGWAILLWLEDLQLEGRKPGDPRPRPRQLPPVA